MEDERVPPSCALVAAAAGLDQVRLDHAGAGVVCWITGLRPRRLLRWVWTPLAAAAAGIAPVLVLEAAGLLDGPPIVGLIVAGACSTLAAGGVLFALEPRARGLALPVVRKMMRRETDTAPA